MIGRIIPSLTKQCSNLDVFCEVCEFAKHTRSTYPAINKKSPKPFMIVHLDVWGPSRFKTVTGYRWFITL